MFFSDDQTKVANPCNYEHLSHAIHTSRGSTQNCTTENKRAIFTLWQKQFHMQRLGHPNHVKIQRLDGHVLSLFSSLITLRARGSANDSSH